MEFNAVVQSSIVVVPGAHLDSDSVRWAALAVLLELPERLAVVPCIPRAVRPRADRLALVLAWEPVPGLVLALVLALALEEGQVA